MQASVNNSSNKPYTVADLYQKTKTMLRKEMEGMKKRPLNEKELKQTEGLAKIMANHVLRDMRII